MTTRERAATTPQVRSTRRRWVILALAVVALVLAVLAARWLRTLPAPAAFVEAYPGAVHDPRAPVGMPVWLAVQHFVNLFLMALVIRAGWSIRTTARPKAYWTRRNAGLLKTRRAPTRISLNVWFHLSVVSLWAANGVVFAVMLFTTGQWRRIVPTSWDVVPNAVSVALQYLSLDAPTENSWVAYNALQQLAYFAVVFVLAPLAAITGLRMSPIWPRDGRFARVLPMERARAVHFPVMVCFAGFIVCHVALVLGTGAVRNLNHMFAAQDTADAAGPLLFGAACLAVVAALLASREAVLRAIASVFGRVGR